MDGRRCKDHQEHEAEQGNSQWQQNDSGRKDDLKDEESKNQHKRAYAEDDRLHGAETYKTVVFLTKVEDESTDETEQVTQTGSDIGIQAHRGRTVRVRTSG